MPADSGYQVDTAAMRDVIRQLTDVLGQAGGSIDELGGLMIPTGCYGSVGSSVASANTALHGQAVVTLRALSTVVREINNRLERCANDYHQTDQDIAKGLSELTASVRGIPHVASADK